MRSVARVFIGIFAAGGISVAFAGVGILKESDPAVTCYSQAQIAMAAAIAQNKPELEAVAFIKSYTVVLEKNGNKEVSDADAVAGLRAVKGMDANNLSALARTVFAQCLEGSAVDEKRAAAVKGCFARNQSFDTYAWFRTAKGSRDEYRAYYKAANNQEISDSAEAKLDQWYSAPIGDRNTTSAGVYEICVVMQGGESK